MPPRARKKTQDENERLLAVMVGYVDPYPALGVAPAGTIDDRCEGCGWTLFVGMEPAVYCVNKKCEKFRYDLRQDVPDEEQSV
jgi:hypothetical protein